MQVRSRQLVFDGLIAVALFVGGSIVLHAGGAWPPGAGVGARSADLAGLLLVACATAPIAARRIVPATVAITVALATSIYLVLGYPYGPVMLAFAIAMYSLARRVALRAAVAIAVGALALLSVHLFVSDLALPGFMGLVPASALIVVPFSIGITRRLYLEARERELDQQQRRAIDDERLRIAHELHDVVGHGLAAIQLRADVARHLRERDPGQAQGALEEISRASAEALAELRATVEGLAPGDRGPMPGLAGVEGLCERIRSAGAGVELTIQGEPRAVSSAVDVAAYRIVQEALTNVVKHASKRSASVDVVYRHDSVALRIASPHDGSRTVPGFGVEGMRRRALGVGGTFVAGPEEDLFVVAAILPSV